MTKNIRANMSQEDEAMPRITKIESKKEKKKLRVAAYCRVSTSQDAQMESLEAQKEHYDQVIKSNEDWVYVGLYYDEGTRRPSPTTILCGIRIMGTATNIITRALMKQS